MYSTQPISNTWLLFENESLQHLQNNKFYPTGIKYAENWKEDNIALTPRGIWFDFSKKL